MGLNFNHAMVYVADVGRALEFYEGLLGLIRIEGSPEFGYARLRFPQGEATLALHLAEKGREIGCGGIRLYFEVAELDEFCEGLVTKGVQFRQLPRHMPWGWRHAYLNDPDGHEISLFAAGEKRFRASP